MLTTGANQYLQPDYLASPLPTTLDAKKSPLALLAQTCSQIGADTSSTKPLIPPLEKKKSVEVEKEKPEKVSDKLAFKPYESMKKEEVKTEEKRESKTPAKSPPTTSSSPTLVTSSGTPTTTTTTTTTSEPTKTTESSPVERRSAGSSPIIRSGLEILHGHPKDIPLGTYKLPTSMNCGGCPPGLDPMTNPAFRSPFGATMLGYPPQFNAQPNPYMAYARVKTVSGAETLVPVCKDPYCTGCQYSLQNAQLLSGIGVCPSGCTQCDHQKFGLPGWMPPQQVSAAAAAAAAYSQHSLMSAQPRPYVCNWIVGDTYCGKRFAGSDELLQHLRTHTNLSTSDGGPLALLNPAAVAAVAAAQHPLLTSPAGLHRTYPNPPLSPLSAARYHPYGKPMPGSPLTATTLASLMPTHPQSLAPYYTSPYSIYGQRLGAAVHP